MFYKKRISNIKLVTGIAALTIFSSSVVWSFALAQDASNSAVEEIRQAVKDKVQERLDQVVRRPVGIVGQITAITDDAITVETSDQSFTVNTSATTEYQRIPGRRTMERADIEMESYTLVKGVLENPDTNQVEGETFQIIPEPEVPERTLINGTVSNKTNSSITVDSQGTTYTITVNNSTDLYERVDGDPEAIKIADIEENDSLIITGVPGTKENTLTSSIVIKLANN